MATNPVIKSIKYLSLLLLITLSLGGTTAIAGDNKLIGHWIGGGIDLNLKSNHRFDYKVKIVKTFHFTGKWASTKNKIIMSYKIAGIKRKKVATYRFKGKNLILKMKGKKEVSLRKQ